MFRSAFRTLAWFAVFICFVALSGCLRTPPPVQEMSDARQALAAAEEAEAERYAPELMARARRLLDAAEANINRRHFLQAKEKAEGSRRVSIEAMKRAQDEAQKPRPDDPPGTPEP